jgi:hypothetical protein
MEKGRDEKISSNEHPCTQIEQFASAFLEFDLFRFLLDIKNSTAPFRKKLLRISGRR